MTRENRVMKIEKKATPTRLEVGMRVKALCMGKLVGDYVVVNVGGGFKSVNEQCEVAFLAVRGDEEKKIEVVVRRDMNNGIVSVISGQKIQCTDYYYEG